MRTAQELESVPVIRQQGLQARHPYADRLAALIRACQVGGHVHQALTMRTRFYVCTARLSWPSRGETTAQRSLGQLYPSCPGFQEADGAVVGWGPDVAEDAMQMLDDGAR